MAFDKHVKPDSSGSRGPASGSSRWMPRVDAKDSARFIRRRQDEHECKEGLCEREDEFVSNDAYLGGLVTR